MEAPSKTQVNKVTKFILKLKYVSNVFIESPPLLG